MKKSKNILIVLGVVVVVVVALFASGILTFEVSMNSSGDESKMEKPLNYETTEFSSEYGFTMSYPKDWIVDTSQKSGPVEFILEPSGKAFIGIQTGHDERLKVFSSRAVAMMEAEKSLTEDKQFSINTFEWKYEDAESNVNSYMATGSFNDKNGTKWLFKEIVVFIPDGTIYFYDSNVLAEFAEEYGPILDKIISSYWPTKNRAESARIKVQLLPEIREYETMLAQSDKKATIEIEEGDDSWRAHVFEIVKEVDGSSHTATFGWYTIDKKTGTVEKEI
ncbi:MAG: hypothetical protein WC705_00375 [Candidatus Paceibacterota bacterium]|jgi:hypothetical protein